MSRHTLEPVEKFANTLSQRPRWEIWANVFLFMLVIMITSSLAMYFFLPLTYIKTYGAFIASLILSGSFQLQINQPHLAIGFHAECLGFLGKSMLKTLAYSLLVLALTGFMHGFLQAELFSIAVFDTSPVMFLGLVVIPVLMGLMYPTLVAPPPQLGSSYAPVHHLSLTPVVRSSEETKFAVPIHSIENDLYRLLFSDESKSGHDIAPNG
tara:strand:- start:87 stop:716 length:630 start_codon:yes stop_codon:yes gene_type:complete